MDMQKQEEIQQKYVKLQMLDKQINQVHKQLQTFDVQLQDLMITKQGLDDLSKTEKGSEILSTISPGIFVKASLTDNKEVIINVGSNVAVKKDIEGAKKLVDEQMDEIKKLQIQLNNDIQQLNNVALKLEQEMQGLM